MYLDNAFSVEDGLESSGEIKSNQELLYWAKREREVLELSRNYRKIRTLDPDIISEVNC